MKRNLTAQSGLPSKGLPARVRAALIVERQAAAAMERGAQGEGGLDPTEARKWMRALAEALRVLDPWRVDRRAAAERGRERRRVRAERAARAEADVAAAAEVLEEVRHGERGGRDDSDSSGGGSGEAVKSGEVGGDLSGWPAGDEELLGLRRAAGGASD